MAVPWKSEVNAPPNASLWVKFAVNAVNLPASVVSMIQRPIALVPASTLPKLMFRLSCAGASFT